MTHQLPTTADVRDRLRLLSAKAQMELSTRSGVPPSTLDKIRYSITPNPGLETVGKFWPILIDMIERVDA